jgi:phenylalanyl-tRNA synthetase beta chain
MKISLNWLRDFVDCRLPSGELEVLLRRAGLEVASMEARGADIDKVVVAQVLASEPHPNADRLSVCKVDDGSGVPRQIVCGAKNYKVGDKVPLALPGAVLPGDFKIKTGKLRGVESEGMMCSAKELRLAEDAEGLLILPVDAAVGAPLSSVFPSDVLLELEITPNRPDWLSHLGVAREIAVFTGLPLTQPVIEAVGTKSDFVRIEAGECSYYTLRKISGVKVGPSPQWLQDRLNSVGLRPINNVVDVTNYVMFELGQPLHAFDAAKVTGGIVVRAAAAGEKFRALDGREYELRGGDLVIADERGVLALAGVMGGEESGVTESTTEILLESAVFDPAVVRRASRTLGLLSDSSYRFERGVDPEMVASASARAARLITEMAGGTADSEMYEVGVHSACGEISLRHARVRAHLGVELTDAEIEEALIRVGLERVSGGVDSTWSVPGYRRDLTREVDLIEEVVRVIGIGRIPSLKEGMFAPASDADAAYDFAMTLRHRLAGAGFHEARTSTLVAAADAEKFGPSVALRNPFGDDQSRLRTSLIRGLLAALRRNLDQGARTVRLFEAGRVFQPDAEVPRLALVVTGRVHPADWRGEAGRDWDVFDLKGLMRGFVRGGEEDFIPLTKVEPPFGAAFEIRLHGTRVGIAGSLHPSEARRLGAGAAVLAAELDLAAWRAVLPDGFSTKPIPKFPASQRDIALVVREGLPFGDVRATLADANEELLESAELFDLFTDPEGVRLPADRKSLAISLTFRSSGRTLTAEEVNAATDRLKGRLREVLGADFRE